MKDAVSCDKLRGAANKLRSGDFRMGKPSGGHALLIRGERIASSSRTEGSEPSQYLQEEKAKAIP